MTRRTNSVPRDPVVLFAARVEAAVELIGAVLDGPDDEAAITFGVLRRIKERLETSISELRAALDGERPAPVAPVTKKRRKAADNGDGPAKSAGIPMGSVTGGLDKDGISLDETD